MSTWGEEEAEAPTIGSEGKEWEVPFVRQLEILEYEFRRYGKGSGGVREHSSCVGDRVAQAPELDFGEQNK